MIGKSPEVEEPVSPPVDGSESILKSFLEVVFRRLDEEAGAVSSERLWRPVRIMAI